MLIVMKPGATAEQVEAVCGRIRELGFVPHTMPGASRTAIGVTGNPGPVPEEEFAGLEGIASAIPVTKPYKLVSREMREQGTVIRIPAPGGAVEVGGGRVAVIAGPCAVEDQATILEAAHAVKEAGARLLRGGAFKPRSSPYSFQGLGEKGLEYLAAAREATGLPVVTEAVDETGVELLERYADVVQVGARNMQNFSLLRRVGQSRLPVLLKRGMSATLEETLQAAEYVLSEGNYNVILCERGVRTFASHTRNTLDLAAVPVLKRLTHLPVAVDPSHGTGTRTETCPMALAAVAAGADCLEIEVHPNPAKARSDGPQSLTPADFAKLMADLRLVAAAVRREI